MKRRKIKTKIRIEEKKMITQNDNTWGRVLAIRDSAQAAVECGAINPAAYNQILTATWPHMQWADRIIEEQWTAKLYRA